MRRASALGIAGAGLGLIGVQLAARTEAAIAPFRQSDNDPVFSTARRGQGLILTGPRMGIVQLRTRRGIVLNGEAMNQITYIPSSGPSMNRVVKRIFGDDMFQPRPAGWQKIGGLMVDTGCELWQRRQPDEWRELAREFGFTSVLVDANWELKLPVVARNEYWVLYDVPMQR